MRRESGQTVIEVLMAIALSAIMLPALATAIVASREGRAQEVERLQATALARQAVEAVNSVREKGWSNIAALTAGSPYRPTISANAWSLTAGAETIGNFNRQVVASDVQRSSGGVIVTSGGSNDSSTRKITITVSWSLPTTGSVVIESYLQRYQGNTTWTQTTQAEFSGGTETNVTVTNNSGGEVELTSGIGSIDWTNPSIVGSYNATGTQDGLDVFAVGNYAYIAGGTVMTIIDITNPASPALVGTYTASATINHIYIDGNYAYLSTISDTAELIIVNITNPASPALAANVNLADTNNALTTFVVGGYAYVGRAVDTTTGTGEFYIVNVTTPASPVIMGNINFTGQVNNIKVNSGGTVAFLATAIDTQEMIVANVTNKSSPSVTTSYNAAGTSDALDLAYVGNTLYVGEVNNTSGAEVFILNVSTPSTPSLLGTYEVGNSITGISVLDSYMFLSSAIVGQQLIVVSVATPSSPVLQANVNLGSNANDVKALGNYVYLASASNTQELIIVGPATTPGGYQTSGTHESSTFDAGASAAFNYLDITLTEPASTDITLQIATNNDNATWNYVGPDGTSGTSYSADGAIRLSTTGRYFRYKATLTGPGTSTPVLSDVTINYSP